MVIFSRGIKLALGKTKKKIKQVESTISHKIITRTYKLPDIPLFKIFVNWSFIEFRINKITVDNIAERRY